MKYLMILTNLLKNIKQPAKIKITDPEIDDVYFLKGLVLEN